MKNRWALGLLSLGVVVVLWVISGFLVNSASSTFYRPCFITYMNCGLMAVYLPAGLAVRRHHSSRMIEEKFSLQETALFALQFCIPWFVSNLLNNASFLLTSVQTAMVLSCTSSIFTFLAGVWLDVEKLRIRNFVPLLVSLAGVALVLHQDRDAANESTKFSLQKSLSSVVLGNIFALASALVYGTYTAILKYKAVDESRLNTTLFFGFVGLFSFCGLWPLVVLFHYTGIELFELPQSAAVWTLLGANSIAIMISDLCWAYATLMTSPLVVTVGLSTTIPLSMFLETIIHHKISPPLYFVGAGMVLWSFIVVSRSEHRDVQSTVNPRIESSALTT